MLPTKESTPFIKKLFYENLFLSSLLFYIECSPDIPNSCCKKKKKKETRNTSEFPVCYKRSWLYFHD